MGLTHVTVALNSMGTTARATYEADFLVDIGATDSLAPAVELGQIGVQPWAQRSMNELMEESRNIHSDWRKSPSWVGSQPVG